MITHLGATRHCGHYTAIGLTSSDKYYEFDDSHVHVMSYDDVARTNGYILFYELVNEMKDKSEIPATISSAEHARLNSKSAMGGGSSTSQKTERVLVEGPKFMTPSILKNYQHQRLKPIVISKGENGEFQTNQNVSKSTFESHFLKQKIFTIPY